jgi:uncharacterized protein (TIGR02145 family)
MSKIYFLLILPIILFSNISERAIYVKKYDKESKTALVIGNADYKHFSKLKNSANDAKDIKDLLSSRGFKVHYLKDSSLKEMEKTLRKFAHDLRKGGVGMVYYAGHGIEVDGQNYLLPVDANIPNKNEVKYESLSVNMIIDKMEDAKNRLNILVLDACRNDPFSRSGSGGLAPINNATGMYVAYSTAPGKVASDGSGKNGLFTKHLINEIQKVQPLEKVFKNTRTSVYKESKGNQLPWTSSSVMGEFYFTIQVENVTFQKPKMSKTKLEKIKKAQVKIEKKAPKIQLETIKDKNEDIYQIIKSPYTNRIWLDRNLGAKRICISHSDEECYGDYYQWGRAADGHEKKESATTSSLSYKTIPEHSKFIKVSNSPYNWQTNPNISLWDGVNSVNNPCPTGFRIPTMDELLKEFSKKSIKKYKTTFDHFLKLPFSGFRYDYDGSLKNQGSSGYVWSSTPHENYAKYLDIGTSTASWHYNSRANGQSVRCIKGTSKN